MGELSGAAKASAAKTAQASSRNAKLAVQALELAPRHEVSERWLLVARTVRDNEGASWAQIGSLVAMSRFEASACFRRLLVAVGLKPRYDRPARRGGGDGGA